MYTLHLMEVILFIFLLVVLIFGQHSLQTNIINNCINSTNSTSCIYTYDQVYNSLAKSENNLNIKYALYPGRSKPSSVRVFVNVYALGPNKTKASTPARYTWSMSCLYAAVPAVVLEFLSLGSILVTPRTQELNIHIPLFCCNVSENKKIRKKKIDERLTRVLAELQDLAVSPGIQDPTLNTAECVIQGHQPSIDATGLSSYIRAILWSSFFSVMFLGPIITFLALEFFGNDPKKKDVMCCVKSASGVKGYQAIACEKKEDPLMRSANCVCHMLLLTEICVISVVIYDLVNQPGFTSKNIPSEIYISISLMFEGIVICVVRCIKQCGNIQCYRWLVFITSANIILYHFCWLVVGIMINPTWGLTVSGVVCFVSVALFFSVHLICDSDKKSFFPRFCMFAATFVGLCFVASLTVLAGQSFYGKDTADQIVKTALLYAVGGITWLLGKSLRTASSEPPDYTISDSSPEHSEDDMGAS